MEILVALDAGTSSIRAVAFSPAFEILSSATRDLPVIFGAPGRVEQDPMQIARLCLEVLSDLEEQLGPKAGQVVSIGLTNQRESVVAWDRADATVLHPLISWQDSRGDEQCNTLKDLAWTITERTGLMLSPYFSATKMSWLGANGYLSTARMPSLGTLDTYLVWMLCGARPDSPFVTDASNASRTMLFNLDSLDFDLELLEIFGVPRSQLPAIVPSALLQARIGPKLPFAGVAIGAVLGDQQASLLGQGCVSKGDLKNTYGSGSFVLANIGNERIRKDASLIESIAWTIPGQAPTFCLEGSIFSTGTIFRWLRDSLKILPSYGEIDSMAGSIRSSDGVVFVPSFQGLGAPHWRPSATGSIFGISAATRPEHLVRSALEGVALRTEEVIEAMEAATLEKFARLVVDGGLSKSDLLCQLQADQLQIPVLRSKVTESTSLGVAVLAGLSAGVFSSLAEVNWPKPVEHFAPKASPTLSKARRELWNRYLARVLD